MTFPALLAVGLAPKAANVTNSVAVYPRIPGERVRQPQGPAEGPANAGGYSRPRSLGTLLGAVLLLVTPAGAFELIVPFLVIGAALRARVPGPVARPGRASARHSPRRQAVALHAMVGSGRCTAGTSAPPSGVMLVAGLGLVIAEELRQISARKNLISAAWSG